MRKRIREGALSAERTPINPPEPTTLTPLTPPPQVLVVPRHWVPRDSIKITAGECRCGSKFAKPTICPEHGLQSKPVTNTTKPRGAR